MKQTTIDILRELNNDFYRRQSASFDRTRRAPWPGWGRCLEYLWDEVSTEPAPGLDRGSIPASSELLVFDLACGNLRFESFLAEALPGVLPGVQARCFGVDDCAALLPADDCPDLAAAPSALSAPGVPTAPTFSFQELDILAALQSEDFLSAHLTAPVCDLSVAFGFLHHVPTAGLRVRVLQTLLDQTKPGGWIIVSLWRFARDPQLAAKAELTTAEALAELQLPTSELDEGDFLVGWQNQPKVWRYCHSFSDTEISDLVRTIEKRATVVALFQSDGRGENLNTYVIARKSK
ncbi:MAG: hypothetical protein LBJ07_01505 [Actinomycetes bacterium]|jgi:SAM-dependent methyltransferase|nr:hypothetical protein [Actinomycetes bacterium]